MVDDRVINFSGEITIQDYMAFMPNSMVTRVGGTLLLFLIGFLLFAACCVCVVSFVRQSNSGIAASAGTMALFAAMMSLLYWATSTKQRTKRGLKKFPNLIRSVDGVLSPGGVVFNNGTNRQWVSWGNLSLSKVTPQGLRLQLSNAADHYLAIDRRMMNGIELSELSDILRGWKTRTITTLDETEAVAAQWLSPIQSDSICFRGLHPAPKGASLGKNWLYLFYEILGLCICTAFLWFRTEISWIMIVGVASVLYSIAIRLYGMFIANPVHNCQWGWLGAQQCVLGWNQIGTESPSRELHIAKLDDDKLTLKHSGGSEWTIFKSTLVEPERWGALVELFQVPSLNESMQESS